MSLPVTAAFLSSPLLCIYTLPFTNITFRHTRVGYSVRMSPSVFLIPILAAQHLESGERASAGMIGPDYVICILRLACFHTLSPLWSSVPFLPLVPCTLYPCTHFISALYRLTMRHSTLPQLYVPTESRPSACNMTRALPCAVTPHCNKALLQHLHLVRNLVLYLRKSDTVRCENWPRALRYSQRKMQYYS